MSSLTEQRDLQAIKDMLERLRKADAGPSTGTTTPTFSGLGGAGSYTYTAQSLTWTRVGNIINFYGRIAISAIGGAPVGGMVILGLPVISAGFGACSWGYVSNLNITAGAYLTGLVLSGDQGIRLMENFDNAASVAYPAANFTNANCDIIFNGWYPV